MTTVRVAIDTPPAAAATDERSARLALQLYMFAAIALFAAMMLVGATMRMTQATWLAVPAPQFYELMTLHGAGMVGTAGLGGALVMWYFLRRHVPLSTGVFHAMLALSVLGVLLILGAIVLGRFAAAWTFLYPLPAKSMGLWSAPAAAAYVLGLTAIGVGFLLFYADCSLALLRRWGSLARSLGLPQLFGAPLEEAPPPAVIASTLVIIVNVLGILAGAVVLVMTLVNLFDPAIAFDALLMKNLIYFFGHVFINAAIYMSVIAVYELLPRYSGRPWKVNRPFIGAWVAAVFLVTAVYPHHLLMDFAMPAWAAALGQIVSFLSGVPVLVVTAWGALGNVARSGMRWDAPSRFLMLGVCGWAVGVIPAVVDGTIVVNDVMHNTLWVPGHFHTYLLLGVLPMIFGFMLYVVRLRGSTGGIDRAAFWLYAAGGALFTLSFMWGGYHGVPRRYAQHLPEWLPSSQVGSAAAVLVIAAMLWVALRVLSRLRHADLAPA